MVTKPAHHVPTRVLPKYELITDPRMNCTNRNKFNEAEKHEVAHLSDWNGLDEQQQVEHHSEGTGVT
jgi:hypothetical protein